MGLTGYILLGSLSHGSGLLHLCRSNFHSRESGRVTRSTKVLGSSGAAVSVAVALAASLDYGSEASS